MDGVARVSESEFQSYKAELFKMISSDERDRNGFVWVTADDSEDINRLARAMKALNEEGRFREYKPYISPAKWAVRV